MSGLYAATADAYARRRGEDPRVATGPVVIFIWDSGHTHDLWLLEYLPELDEYERELFAPPNERLEVLGGGTVPTVPISHDCRDGFMGAYWRRPAEYLVPEAQQAISSLAQLDPAARERGLARLERDLADGTWATRYAHLLDRTELDLGYRLVVGRHT